MMPSCRISRRQRLLTLHAAMCCSQLLLFAVSGLVAFLIRFEFSVPERDLVYLAVALPAWGVVKGITFHLLRLDCGGWRYASVPDIVRLAIGNVVGSGIAVFAIMFLAPGGFPRSIYVLDLLVCSLATAAARLIARLLLSSAPRSAAERKKIVICGAGKAGVTLLSEIRSNPQLPYQVCGFVDDDSNKVGQLIQGVAVLGSGAELTALAAKHGLAEVLICDEFCDGLSRDRCAAQLP